MGRGGIQSIPQSQWVTARALSFSRWQTWNVMEVDALTFRTFGNLTFLAFGYLAITIPISLLSKQPEKKFFYAS